MRQAEADRAALVSILVVLDLALQPKISDPAPQLPTKFQSLLYWI